jgi:hypothetical protein
MVSKTQSDNLKHNQITLACIDMGCGVIGVKEIDHRLERKLELKAYRPGASDPCVKTQENHSATRPTKALTKASTTTLTKAAPKARQIVDDGKTNIRCYQLPIVAVLTDDGSGRSIFTMSPKIQCQSTIGSLLMAVSPSEFD